MAYKLNYSDYSTTEGPPNPAEWVGPAGPQGVPGPPGPAGPMPPGGPFLPLSGGTVTGPLLLVGPPAAPLQAATKAYADSVTAGGSSGTVGGAVVGSVGATGTSYGGYTLSWGDDFNENAPSIISPMTPHAKYFDMITYTATSVGQGPRFKYALSNYDPGSFDSGNDDVNKGVPIASWQDLKTQANSVLSLKVRHAIGNELNATGMGKFILGSLISSGGVAVGRYPVLLEARIRTNPANKLASAGYHPTFWSIFMGPMTEGDGLETDWESDNTATLNPTGYLWTNNPSGATGMPGGKSGSAVCPNLFDGNWHTVGLDITATGVRQWCDGVLVNTLTQDYTSYPNSGLYGPRPNYWILTAHTTGATSASWGARTVNATGTWGNAATTISLSTPRDGIQAGMVVTGSSGGGIAVDTYVTGVTGTQTVNISPATTAAGTSLPVTFSWPSAQTAAEAILECDWVRMWRQTGQQHRAPQVTQPDFYIPFGGSFSIMLPSAASVWGDASVAETLEMAPHSARAPGGNINGMFQGQVFPPSVTYSGGVLAGTIKDQPGTMWFVRTGTKPGETCEVQRWRGCVGPRILTPGNVNMTVGTAFNYDFYPDMDVGDLLPLTLSVSGLPSGLSYVPAGSTKGVVTGTPTATGTVAITLTNAVGQQVTANVTMGPRTAGSGTPLPAGIFPNFPSLAAAGLVGSLDFDDDALATIGTGYSQLTGADGTVYAAAQPTAGAQPTRVTLNNCHAARFTAANSQYLNWDTLAPSWNWNGPLTLVVVTKLATIGSWGLLDIGMAAASSTAQRADMLATTSWTFRCGSSATGDATDPTAVDATGTYLLVGRRMASPASLGFINRLKNGYNYLAGPLLGAPGNGATIDTATVGARHAAGAYGLFADATIFRVLVFDRFLEDYEFNQLASWSAATFGTA